MNTSELVLYVDDERSNRIVFEQSFGGKFRIRTAESAERALEILKGEDVALLVTDQRMPGMSGNDLLLRARDLHPAVVRIVVTAYSDLEPILRAVNEGLVARYVIKPWDRAELEQILSWGLGAYRLGQQSTALQLRLLQTERLVTIGSIGAAVMHDLAQPLSYLLTNSERLGDLAPAMPALKRLATAHAREMAEEDARALEELADELPQIVSDMMTGCRIIKDLAVSIRRIVRPASAGVPERSADPMPVIRYALSICRDIALPARGTVDYDGPVQLPKVAMGSTELSQVLINLVSNAAQALLRREGLGGHVRVSAAESEGELRIAVLDDGPGMSPEVLANVGKPFFSTRPEGTGLGVMQCRRLIEAAGGKLTIDSVEGKGTTVVFSLPKA